MKTADEIWKRVEKVEEDGLLVFISKLIAELDEATEYMYKYGSRLQTVCYESYFPSYIFECGKKEKCNAKWLSEQPEIKEFLKKAGGLIITDCDGDPYTIFLRLPDSKEK